MSTAMDDIDCYYYGWRVAVMDFGWCRSARAAGCRRRRREKIAWTRIFRLSGVNRSLSTVDGQVREKILSTVDGQVESKSHLDGQRTDLSKWRVLCAKHTGRRPDGPRARTVTVM